jgi:hypothetical protein
MGKPKTPPALNRFLPVDFETLQYVMEHGQLTIKFHTDNQAMNTKYRLWRLKESLQVNAKGDPLQKASLYFVFKVKQSVLTISDRAKSQEAEDQKAALRGEVDVLSADPQEMMPLDIAEIERLIKEQENGN